jgi:hypothetical protein
MDLNANRHCVLAGNKARDLVDLMDSLIHCILQVKACSACIKAKIEIMFLSLFFIITASSFNLFFLPLMKSNHRSKKYQEGNAR